MAEFISDGANNISKALAKNLGCEWRCRLIEPLFRQSGKALRLLEEGVKRGLEDARFGASCATLRTQILKVTQDAELKFKSKGQG